MISKNLAFYLQLYMFFIYGIKQQQQQKRIVIMRINNNEGEIIYRKTSNINPYPLLTPLKKS